MVRDLPWPPYSQGRFGIKTKSDIDTLNYHVNSYIVFIT